MTKKSGNARRVDAPEITPSCGNVFLDLGFELEEALELEANIIKELQLRNDIKQSAVAEINGEIARRGLNKTQAAEMLQISRPRLSDITHLKVEKFSTDSVFDLLFRLGKVVKLVIEPAPPLAAATKPRQTKPKSKAAVAAKSERETVKAKTY